MVSIDDGKAAHPRIHIENLPALPGSSDFFPERVAFGRPVYDAVADMHAPRWWQHIRCRLAQDRKRQGRQKNKATSIYSCWRVYTMAVSRHLEEKHYFATGFPLKHPADAGRLAHRNGQTRRRHRIADLQLQRHGSTYARRNLDVDLQNAGHKSGRSPGVCNGGILTRDLHGNGQ